MAAQDVIRAIQTIRQPPGVDEMALHDAVGRALEAAGIAFQREAVLGPGNRIDFLTEEGTGIEIKKGKPSAPALRRQLERYARWDCVRDLVVITQRKVPLPDTILNKPCIQQGLGRLWGIAL